jgi:hypothetical protein
MTSRFALTLAVAMLASSLQISQSQAQQRPLLVCTGTLSQANNMTWDQRRVEFSLDPAGNAQVTNLKSDIGSLNAVLLLERRDDFLIARESQPRSIGTDDRSLAVTELRISRNTGAFTLAVSLYRNMDVLEGKSLWEGTCALKGAAEKKF